MKRTCAICTAETDDCQPTVMDGRPVFACLGCNTEHPRSGRYGFDTGAQPSRALADGTTRRGKAG